MRRPYFWMVWRYHGVPRVHFYFLFRNNVGKRFLDESDFCQCYGNFSETAILKIPTIFKVPSQQWRGTLTTAFERYLTVKNFPDMDKNTCQFLHQRLSKHHKAKINEGALKIITCKKIRPHSSKNIAPK